MPPDSSPHTRGRRRKGAVLWLPRRFIPSCEGQTLFSIISNTLRMIHPLLRGADKGILDGTVNKNDSSPHTRGRPQINRTAVVRRRFIPSYEGQTLIIMFTAAFTDDSSPHTRGRHSMFMRLSAALSTSLCNLHKCPFQLQLVTHHFLYL